MKLFYLMVCIGTLSIHALQLTQQEIQRVGMVIWQNECKKKTEHLIFWNPNEEFPSLGIGHFIWHTKNYKGPFTQQFPELMAYFKKNNIKTAAWMDAPHAPWPNQDAFLADRQSTRMQELLKLLLDTIDLQAEFIVNRFETVSVPAIIKSLSGADRNFVNKQLQRLYATPGGTCAVIDYVNFKGDGTNLQERYNNKGWGLLHVLLNMKETDSPLQDFATSAQQLLKTRVENAPKERKEQEQRFLPGWNNRIKSYLSIK